MQCARSALEADTFVQDERVYTVGPTDLFRASLET